MKIVLFLSKKKKKKEAIAKKFTYTFIRICRIQITEDTALWKSEKKPPSYNSYCILFILLPFQISYLFIIFIYLLFKGC